MTTPYLESGLIDWRGGVDRTPPTFLDWAEAEIKIPDGPFQGLAFRRDRQPVQELLLREYGKSVYRRYAVTGCTQSGKSLCAFVLPILYHVFCLGETICAGVPHQDMAHDKWREDLLPVFEQTRYRELLPRQGSGSRGGKLNSVKFRNGATLRFLSAAGGDKSRAGFTSRVLACTEVDGYDHMSERSDESDKLTQMEGRLLAYGARARTYLECTVSTEEGRIWQEYLRGTKSACMVPCPECGEHITLERENLVGWQDARTEGEAVRRARWLCLLCGAHFDDTARTRAHRHARIVHDGQTIDRHGNISGTPPDTHTFSFRWSAGNNLFLDAGFIAAQEWRAVRDADADSANRKMCQQFWTIPPPPPRDIDETLSVELVEERAQGWPRGMVPEWAPLLTIGVDVGKYLVHWVACAWSVSGHGQIVDYGIIDTNADALGEERGVESALYQAEDLAKVGWVLQARGERVLPCAGLIDSGYLSGVVYKFTKAHARWAASKGQGITQQNRRLSYRQPKTTGASVLKIGENYHWSRLARPRGQTVIEFDSDHFKSWIHSRLHTPDGQPGTLRLFGTPAEHMQFAKHITAEQEIYDRKLGITRWSVLRRQNHFLDALVLSAVAARTKGMVAVPVEDAARAASAQAQKPQTGHAPTTLQDRGNRPAHQAARLSRRIRARY